MQRIWKKPLTIKKELFLLGFVFLIAVSFLYAGIFIKSTYNSRVSDARNALRECNSQIVTYTEGLFHENATIVEILSRDSIVINAGFGDMDAVLDIYEPILKGNSKITYLYSGYKNGQLYISNYKAPVNFNPLERPWYQAASAADGVARLVYQDATTNEWLFSQCKSLLDQNGKVVGAIAIDCSNENITGQLRTKYQYQTQRSFILNPDGVILIHPSEPKINQNMRGWMDDSIWNSIVSGKNNYAEYMTQGSRAIAYFERIPDTEFIVATAIDGSEITTPIIRNALFMSFFILGISVLLGFLLSRILIYRFARPVMELGARIQKLATGSLDETKELRSSNAEINSIADSIEIIVKDIANREELRKAAEYQSFHDSLTGLYNRRFFEEEARRLDVGRNYPLVIIGCDINGLKLVNDVFGHAVGDKLILAVASCLEMSSRADDILARIGGDEFAILLPRTSEEDAKQIIRRIKATFLEQYIHGVKVSASLGYAIKTDYKKNMDTVLQEADKMMYEKKRNESTEMKRHTVCNIIQAAQKEGLIHPLTKKEEWLLELFADQLCKDTAALLKESYRLRRLGLCSILQTQAEGRETADKQHTEMGYRILSSIEEYRSVAGCILYYMEHWDGNGWPTGLSGLDIPLLARIIAIVEAYIESSSIHFVFSKSGTWYDPSLVEILGKLVEDKK